MFSRKSKNKNRTYGEISLDRLKELNNMAFYDIVVDEGENIPEGAITYPEKATGFEYQIYYLFRRTIKDGMMLYKSINRES